jgi:hypothetical protein
MVMSFQPYYRQLFDTFGYPLDENTAVSSSCLSEAAKSLGITIPTALADYYAVAGNEKQFNQAFNLMMPINDWYIDKKHLVFLEENQAGMLWGVTTDNPENDAPPVSQSVNLDELQWFEDHQHCSQFIAVILHFQAVAGGLDHRAYAPEPPHLRHQLESGWKCYGTVNRLSAYSRQNQVVCIEPEMGVMMAGKSKEDLQNIKDELGLKS